MTYYNELCFYKNNPKIIRKYLEDFLLFQIYSPQIIRHAFRQWPEVLSFVRQSTPAKIVDLIENSFLFSDENLQKKLNKYHIEKAIKTLKAYQNCGVPLTNDPTVKQTRRKLTSPKGDKALKILQNAQANKQWTDKMADLGIACSHKFFFDKKYYRQFNISSQIAQDMAIPLNDSKNEFQFPAIQLTKGCTNNCSHCCARAEPHLSHMPWPIFTALYDGFNKHYRHYQQEKTDAYFCQFFDDSDMLSYHDHIMDVDSGDVTHWIDSKKGHCQILTRGVTDTRSEIALAKAMFSNCPITVSFVDTPKENMKHNLEQLNKTLDVFECLPQRKINPEIFHLHLNSGPTVDEKIFRNFPVEKRVIWSLGKGKEFPPSETENHPDDEYLMPFVITPSGHVNAQEVKNAECCSRNANYLYRVKKHKPLLKRFLSYFRSKS